MRVNGKMRNEMEKVKLFNFYDYLEGILYLANGNPKYDGIWMED